MASSAVPESPEIIDTVIGRLREKWTSAREALQSPSEATGDRLQGFISQFEDEAKACLGSPLHMRQVLTELTHMIIRGFERIENDPAHFTANLDAMNSEAEARAFKVVQCWIRSVASGDESRISEVRMLTFIAVTSDPPLMSLILHSCIDIIETLDVYEPEDFSDDGE